MGRGHKFLLFPYFFPDMSLLRLCKTGRDKRANIAALRQAKIYPPRQAAAAAIHKMEHFTLWIAARGLQLVHCGSQKIKKMKNEREGERES